MKSAVKPSGSDAKNLASLPVMEMAAKTFTQFWGGWALGAKMGYGIRFSITSSGKVEYVMELGA